MKPAFLKLLKLDKVRQCLPDELISVIWSYLVSLRFPRFGPKEVFYDPHKIGWCIASDGRIVYVGLLQRGGLLLISTSGELQKVVNFGPVHAICADSSMPGRALIALDDGNLHEMVTRYRGATTSSFQTHINLSEYIETWFGFYVVHGGKSVVCILSMDASRMRLYDFFNTCQDFSIPLPVGFPLDIFHLLACRMTKEGCLSCFIVNTDTASLIEYHWTGTELVEHRVWNKAFLNSVNSMTAGSLPDGRFVLLLNGAERDTRIGTTSSYTVFFDPTAGHAIAVCSHPSKQGRATMAGEYLLTFDPGDSAIYRRKIIMNMFDTEYDL
ncbi:hypothetical protein Pmar_PMAR020751 [Perkinsus marinus ATCC 50983]|uniref:Uncharacterized protein n=1 Tax=Perkinsus marinus (strain ATCC 50983 / TXsc) TaxID=423536 RepID=C5KQR5_PERM5|nr:hypothetical protein Pmar_PMAR020751 [Perkinsus marinus ATCC 50983]EER13161.1 hypothetical protein Pmar_PMAR020751 [Perkinsus marinus ATCC 50983]|eukprot:XP_002781366.1 hypothetical protein Pmar_PMAR020751 [Perkinsus marinus ATCC 50983]